MIILRNKLYSNDNNNIPSAAIIGGAGVVGSIAANSALYKSMMSTDNPIDDKKISQALLEKAKKQGIKIVNDPGFDNSAYTGTKYAKIIRKKVLDRIKKLKRKGKSTANESAAIFGSPVRESLGHDRIVLGSTEFLKSAPILSHELGHAQYSGYGNRSNNILLKGSHDLYTPTKMVAFPVSLANGVRSGYKSEKLKKEGKKESTWNKVNPYVLPVVLSAPMLIAEGGASAKGIKMMKEAGANKELLKHSKKTLGKSFGTYASLAGVNVASGAVGRGIGKVFGRDSNRYDDYKKRENDNNKK